MSKSIVIWYLYSIFTELKKLLPIGGLIVVILLLILRPTIGWWFFGSALYSIIRYVILPIQAIYLTNTFFVDFGVKGKFIILCLLVWMILENFFGPLGFVDTIVSFLFGWTYRIGFNSSVMISIIVYLAKLSILGIGYYWLAWYFGEE